MAKMDFKEFANRLSKVIRCGSTTAEFTKTLFSSIVNDDGQEIVEKDYKYSSFKAFYNGNATICNISIRIRNYIDEKAFKDFIKGHGSAALNGLCEEYKDIFPEATNRSIASNLSALFKSIIIESTSVSTNNTVLSTVNKMGRKQRQTTKKTSKKTNKSVSQKPTKPSFVNNLNKSYFRENEIADIKQRLMSKQKSCLAISAESGLGKTTIAKEIFNDTEIQFYYSAVIWVDYVGNLDDSIVNSINISDEIIERSIRLSKIHEYLRDLGSQVLIIIDNVRFDESSKQDPLTEQGKFTVSNISSLSPYINLLITTRIDSLDGYDMIRIQRLSMERGTEMFLYHYNSLTSSATLSNDDIVRINDIVYKSDGIPFLIMLLAKQAATTSIKALHQFLKGYLYVQEDVLPANTTISDLLKAIITYKNVSLDERRILIGFATLPNIFISATECKDWFEYDLHCVNKLAIEGWLDLESTSETHYRMHDLIKNAVITNEAIGLIDANSLLDEDEQRSINKEYRVTNYWMSYKIRKRNYKIPLDVNVYTALVNKIESENEHFMQNAKDYSQINRLIETLIACSECCILTNLQQAKLTHWIASYSFKHKKDTLITSEYYHYAISAMGEAIKFASSRAEEFECNNLCMRYYYDYGRHLSLLENTKFDESKDAMSKALAYCNRTYNRNSPQYYIDNEYSRVSAYIERALMDRDPSLINISFLKTVFLRKENTLRDPEKVKYILRWYAVILDHWGYLNTVSNDGKFIRARIYLEIAYKIGQALYETEPTEYKALLARIEDNLGYLLFHIDPAYYSESEKLLKKAQKKRQELMLTARDEFLSEYAWTVNDYAELLTCIGGNRLDEAKRKYEKAIKLLNELNERNYGKYNYYIAWSTYGLGRCLARQNNPEEKLMFDQALNYYKVLSEEDKAYEKDCERVRNVDIDIENVFEPWMGNHRHFT